MRTREAVCRGRSCSCRRDFSLMRNSKRAAADDAATSRHSGQRRMSSRGRDLHLTPQLKQTGSAASVRTTAAHEDNHAHVKYTEQNKFITKKKREKIWISHGDTCWRKSKCGLISVRDEASEKDGDPLSCGFLRFTYMSLFNGRKLVQLNV